jgi:hypothetical protein
VVGSRTGAPTLGSGGLVRIRLLRNLSWITGAMHLVTNHVRQGEHRGGMFVEVTGRSVNGDSVVREWHLLAEGDDGPLIPCMAVEAVIRKALAGDPPPAGARTAISDVDLSNYEALFARRAIFTGVRERAPTTDTSVRAHSGSGVGTNSARNPATAFRDGCFVVCGSMHG